LSATMIFIAKSVAAGPCSVKCASYRGKSQRIYKKTTYVTT
jgi:hypothetical protein